MSFINRALQYSSLRPLALGLLSAASLLAAVTVSDKAEAKAAAPGVAAQTRVMHHFKHAAYHSAAWYRHHHHHHRHPAAHKYDGHRETAAQAIAKHAQPAPAVVAQESNPIAAFFGKIFQSQPVQVASAGASLPRNMMAYAAPEQNEVYSPSVRADNKTAVYDVKGKTVTLPDGTKLEAHSGLGDARDDPRRDNEPMRGPTPSSPSGVVYRLTFRESLFHGVKALRLNPVKITEVHGRSGLLTHTFMLGAGGDSNGCISFKDYAKFLWAYESGQVNKIVAIGHIGEATQTASYAPHYNTTVKAHIGKVRLKNGTSIVRVKPPKNPTLG